MKLNVIKNDIQKVAEAISLVMNIDVTIVNDEMERIAGTGIYKDKIGEIINFESAFKKSFVEKKILIIDNPKKCSYCKNCYNIDSCKEEAEVCCPIVLDDRCYGVIGLIAFDQEQKEKLIGRREELETFIEKMASLISGNINAEIKSMAYDIERKKMAKILDSIDRPMVSVNKNGLIDSYNKKFVDVFCRDIDDVKNKYIEDVVDFIPREEFLKLRNNNKHSNTFFSEKVNMKGIYSINKIFYKKNLIGFVIDFVDRKDTIRNYNKMNVNYALSFDDIIGESNAISSVKEVAKLASKSTSTILITGESGTGKELFARAIHYQSDRGKKPFVAINCAAIPEELLESELFGYEEGAFTGAKKGGKIGMFEFANKGTIFLDEIGDMSIHLQAKLLRVLQEKEIQKVGAKKSIPVDVRIISATNKDLKSLVEKDMFREDLFYRLNVLPINIPSLRERPCDISLLVEHMIKVYSEKLGKNIISMSENCMQILKNYSWPGNIRELQNVIEYCVNMTNKSIIDDEEMLKNRFKVNLKAKDDEIESNMEENVGLVKFKKLEDIEKDEIQKALSYYEKYKNDKQLVCKALGISMPTLYRKIKKYGIAKGNHRL